MLHLQMSLYAKTDNTLILSPQKTNLPQTKHLHTHLKYLLCRLFDSVYTKVSLCEPIRVSSGQHTYFPFVVSFCIWTFTHFSLPKKKQSKLISSCQISLKQKRIQTLSHHSIITFYQHATLFILCYAHVQCAEAVKLSPFC